VWKNDATHTFKIAATATTIAVYVDGQKQFGPIPESNNADGRIGIGGAGSQIRVNYCNPVGGCPAVTLLPVVLDKFKDTPLCLRSSILSIQS
jgi:hypothetical protein